MLHRNSRSVDGELCERIDECSDRSSRWCGELLLLLLTTVLHSLSPAPLSFVRSVTVQVREAGTKHTLYYALT